MMFQVMYMMLVGRDITVLFSDPSVLFSEAYDWLMSKFASPSTPSNMDAVGWTWWLTALGIPRLFAMADDGMELLLTYAQDQSEVIDLTEKQVIDLTDTVSRGFHQAAINGDVINVE